MVYTPVDNLAALVLLHEAYRMVPDDHHRKMGEVIVHRFAAVADAAQWVVAQKR